jgi:glycosyltransferase involved in cell wall biosynthesis
MRIGFDITALYVAQAGVFTYSHNLLRALLEKDHKNEYLLLDYTPLRDRRANPREISELLAPNAAIIHCGGLRQRRLARWETLQDSPLRSLAALVDEALLRPWSAAAKATLHRTLAQVLAGVDVFHASDVLLWRQAGALNVITIYDLTALLLPECHTANTREMQSKAYRFAQEQADVVIALSEATRRDILAHLHIPPDRVRVVHSGVSLTFRPIDDRKSLEQALAPFGLSPGSYILHVGTIEPRKNLIRLVEAYHQIQGMVPAPVPKLALAGAKGWRFREVFERVRALELEAQIIFLRSVPPNALPALYNGACLFVYPSLYEGFGLPPLEAMACGVPVVASNTSSLPEVIGDAGLLIDPTDTQALAAAMASLLDDAEQCADLSERGLARAARFSWERAAGETLEIYATAKE